MNDIIFDLGIFVGVVGTLVIESVVVGLIKVLWSVFGKENDDAEE